MSRLLARCLPFALLAALGSCTRFGIFEDVGFEPHPPSVQLLGIAFQPPEEEEPPPAPTPTVATPDAAISSAPEFLPADGFEVQVNDPARSVLVLRVRYQDAGGDIQRFRLRDRDSALSIEFVPSATIFDLDGDGIPDVEGSADVLVGTSGIVWLPDVSFTPTMIGPHRMELWAEDSNESRSPKVTFTINALFATR